MAVQRNESMVPFGWMRSTNLSSVCTRRVRRPRPKAADSVQFAGSISTLDAETSR